MVTIDQLKAGVARYADAEIMPRLTGWKKLAFGTASALIIARGETYLTHPIIKAMGVVDGNNIDIDRLYQEARKHATEPISIDIPAFGSLRMDVSDIDRLYQCIMGG